MHRCPPSIPPPPQKGAGEGRGWGGGVKSNISQEGIFGETISAQEEEGKK